MSTADLPQQIRSRLAATLSNWEPEAQETRPYLELLLGLHPQGAEGVQLEKLEPEQLRRQIFVAMLTILKHQTAGQSLVLLLDDIQWMDPLSSQLLQFLSNVAVSAPVFFICIQRVNEPTCGSDCLAVARQLLGCAGV